MKSYKKTLGGFALLYLILAALALVVLLAGLLVPAVSDAIAQAMNVENAQVVFAANVVVNGAIYLLYWWLLKKYVAGQSNGTVLMVLLGLGVIGGPVTMFTTAVDMPWNSVIDAVVLIFMVLDKKQAKA